MTGVAQVDRRQKPSQNGSLTTVLVFVDDYDLGGWGWWCPQCSTADLTIMQDGYANRAKALRSAHKHETRRGH